MSMTDPIADLLTRIRNGLRAGHPKVVVPASNMKLEIVKILQSEGYIEAFAKSDVGPQGQIEIEFRPPTGGDPAITGLERVSRPGRRVYRGKDEIPKVLNGLGVNILSTSRGVMTGRECREKGVGGEILCKVW